jgi:uncharacterized BrkB/YihY/UPF0761 family membrane protein
MKGIGCLLILLGIALGLYVGLWLLFIGGIVQIVEAVKADPVSSWGIAFGIVRIILAAPVGWGAFFLCFGMGAVVTDD